ncbi:MAG: hypothetical protein ACJLS2_11310 [Microcella pacifica]
MMIASLAGCFPVGPGVGGDGTDGEPLVTPDDSNGGTDDAESSPDWLDESDPQARAEGCLVGTWTLDNEAWGAEVMSLPEFAGGTATFSGEKVLDWSADGAYEMRADEHTMDARVVGNGADADVQIVFDGVEGGTWTASGDTLFAMDPSGEDFTTTVSAEIDGQSVQVEAREIATDAWSGSLEVDCQVDTLATTTTEESDGQVLTANWTRD